MMEMPPRYNALESEPLIYAAQEAAGLFQPSLQPGKPRFCITIPPPNITGSLHMGHALTYPLQDMIGRYQRLRGFDVLVLPGQDHAGIATQSVVEKQLKKEGSSGAALGREKFIERVWQWREESGSTILHQFRALGCAYDWSRSRFTLDPDYVEAVLRVFVEWYKAGYIYRGKRVVNWDPKLGTSVSDIETVRDVRKGHLYHIRYPFTDGSGEIVIATTRPETMLADVAVAVHPSDSRYQGKHGALLTLPLSGRQIPVVADLYPDPEFGTGAVKITPAHDPNDFEVGVRHNLPMPLTLNPAAKVDLTWMREHEPQLVAPLEKYEGLDRLAARAAIVEDLEKQGFLVAIEDHEIPIIISDRSGEVIEPMLSEQWFARQTELAQPVIEAVRKDEVRFHPPRYKQIFLSWMENIRDWNISRQLWWGHRVPAFYTEEGECFVALNWEEAQKEAGDKKIVRQDDDVLDTWFSSGMWPFATLGWPQNDADLTEFYPTQTLVTDRNIINLWVARMLMMGYDLIGRKPFSDVVIHATVLREDGRRMSKSLGTGVDPMEVINTLGADVLRWTLLSQTGENQDIRYSEKRNEDARNFCNKIWNAARFVLMNVDRMPEKPGSFDPVDRWLLSRLVGCEKEVREAYDRYDLQTACQTLYRFFWSEVCDWYIEISKSRLQNREIAPQWVLLTVFDSFLKFLNPVMPFITEALYEYLPLPNKSRFLMSANWPELDPDLADSASEHEIEQLFGAIRSLRALRAELDMKPMQTFERVYAEGEIAAHRGIIASQAWFKEVVAGRPGSNFVSTSFGGFDFHIELGGLIDLEKVLVSIERELEKAEKEIIQLENRLKNPQFIERAKPEIVERDRELLDEIKTKVEKLRDRRSLLSQSEGETGGDGSG